jgi:DNA-binding IclR family transcriptional regulator
MATWSFLTKHGQALLCVAGDPEMRLRDIAAALDVTERHAHGIINDLVDAGYLMKEKQGRRNRYEIQDHLPLPEAVSRQRAIGDVLKLLVGSSGRAPSKKPGGSSA